MKTSTRIILATLLAIASGTASAIKCKEMVGTWLITYDLLGDWTETVVITAVKGSKVIAEGEFGDPLTAVCKNGMVFAVEGDSDYIVSSYYFSDKFGSVASVFTSDSIFEPVLLSSVHAVTRIERAGGLPASAAVGGEDRASTKEARDLEHKARFLQEQANQ